MSMQRYLAQVVLGLVLVLVAASAQAVTITGTVVFTPDCTAINVSGGGTVTFDRDNTGAGTEALVLEARDGAGFVIFTVTDARTVGTTGVGFSSSYAYTGLPAANPITARLYSMAGNGLAEVTAVSGVGSCSRLAGGAIPTLDVRGLAAFSLALAAAAFLALRRSGV